MKKSVLLFTKNLSSEKPPKYPVFDHFPSEIALKSQKFSPAALFRPINSLLKNRRASRAKISSIYPCKTGYCGPFLKHFRLEIYEKSSFFRPAAGFRTIIYKKSWKVWPSGTIVRGLNINTPVDKDKNSSAFKASECIPKQQPRRWVEALGFSLD